MFTHSRWLWLALLLYCGLIIAGITWGLPNADRVFIYQMDEWHQLNSVKAAVTQGSISVPGAANGLMWHFLLMGAYSAPFILSGIVDTSQITSAVTGLEMQQRLFVILRFSTLLFGLGSVAVLHDLMRRFFGIKSQVAQLFLLLMPGFVILSRFFKYDVALLFWIFVTIWVSLWYARRPTGLRYACLGFVAGLTLATKVSAVPILGVLGFAFVLFDDHVLRSWASFGRFAQGLSAFVVVVLLVGIPDVLFGIARLEQYYDLFFSNLVLHPAETGNMILTIPWWLQLWGVEATAFFGTGFWLVFLGAQIYFFKKLWRNSFEQRLRYVTFLFGSFWLFVMSLVPLKLSASGNRLLVLVPFMVILVAVCFEELLVGKRSKLVGVMLAVAMGLQVVDLASWQYVHFSPDIRMVSSDWIEAEVVVGSSFGLETGPLYRFEPDSILKDYFFQQYQLDVPARYAYTEVTAETVNFPEYVIVTNVRKESWFKETPKKKLIQNLENDGYRVVAEFETPLTWQQRLAAALGLPMPKIDVSPFSITIYSANH